MKIIMIVTTTRPLPRFTVTDDENDDGDWTHQVIPRFTILSWLPACLSASTHLNNIMKKMIIIDELIMVIGMTIAMVIDHYD